VGTPAYMSPEQARGKVVDKRTDIWAYGCCLYEALTGQRSFRGETASDTLAMILAAEPDWKALPEGTPPRLRELLGLCLSKDLRGRLCDIGDARLELSQIASNPGTASAATALPAGAIMVRRSRLVAATIAGLLVASLAGAAVWNFMRPAVLPNQRLKIPQGVVRLTMELPPESAIANDPAGTRFGRTRFALSPDASRLVYTGGMAGESKLYLRRMDRLETSPLPGTDGAVSPFFSPDGQSVGFFASGKLKTIGVDGSRPVELCDAQNPAGASWGRDGMIYFAENFVSGSPANRGLMRIHDSGGVAELFTHSESDPKVIGHVFPCALPDGKSLVFSLANNVGTKQGYGDFSLAALSLKTGQWKVVLAHGFCAQYASTGHLVFFNDGWYYAARFDMNLIQVVGPRVPVLQSVFVPALSNTGCLVHGPQIAGGLPGGRRPTRPLVWVNRRGETERWKSPPRSYADLRLSPDGKRLAASVFDERGPDIWILDIERETDSPLTFEGLNTAPVWTPDGQRVIFRSRLGEKPNNLFTAPVDGSAPPQPLAPSDLDQGAPGSVSSDGRLLAFTTSGAVTGSDIYTLSLENGGAVKPLIQTEFIEAFPTFSPDGRWLAYQSDEKGRREVFVQPYPPTGAKRQVSDEGGSKPRWSAKGDEIFYRNGTKLYAVPIETEPAFKPGRPKLLFEKPFVETNTRTDYDVAPDGERFVFLELTAEEAARKPVHQLFVVQNWFEELERLAPPIAAEQSAR
jgi:serine/threonine-protein kinase